MVMGPGYRLGRPAPPPFPPFRESRFSPNPPRPGPGGLLPATILEVRPKRLHALFEVGEGAPVVDHVVGSGQLALGGGLGGDHSRGLRRRHAAPGDHPLDLVGLLGGDDDQRLQAEGGPRPGLDEERRVDDDEGTGGIAGSEAPGDLLEDQRMDDGLEVAS